MPSSLRVSWRFFWGGVLLPSVASAQSNLAFYSIGPCRLVDTRNSGGAINGGQSRTFTIVGAACGAGTVPSNALAYSFNVTAIPNGALNYLTIWPHSQSQPYVSTLNSQNGQVIANAAIVSAGSPPSYGQVDVYVSDTSNVLIDINRYFAAPSAGWAFFPLTPCRVVDTRNANGPYGGPIMGAGSTRTFNLPNGSCNIPGSAQAYALNVTAIPPGALEYLTAWPAGQSQPITSTLNSLDGRIVANAALVTAGTTGTNIYVSDQTHVLIDINGYFAGTGSNPLYLTEAPPCRVVDTRNPTGTFGGPSLPAGGTRSFPLPSGSCSIPSNAQAYSLNVTAIPPASLFYLTIWPTGQTQPIVSTLNDTEGIPTANAALVPAGSSAYSEAVSVYVSDASNVVLDINGYFVPPVSDYTLTTSVNPPGAGTVTLTPSGGYYTAGTLVQVTATANTGYQFAGFSGSLTGTTNPQILTMPSANTSVTANFSSCTSGIDCSAPNTVTAAASQVYQWEPSSVSPGPGATWVHSFNDFYANVSYTAAANGSEWEESAGVTAPTYSSGDPGWSGVVGDVFTAYDAVHGQYVLVATGQPGLGGQNNELTGSSAYFATSGDGIHWSTLTPVLCGANIGANNACPANTGPGRYAFDYPSVAVDSSGRIIVGAVAYQDSGTPTQDWGYWVNISSDGGNTWSGASQAVGPPGPPVQSADPNRWGINARVVAAGGQFYIFLPALQSGQLFQPLAVYYYVQNGATWSGPNLVAGFSDAPPQSNSRALYYLGQPSNQYVFFAPLIDASANSEGIWAVTFQAETGGGASLNTPGQFNNVWVCSNAWGTCYAVNPQALDEFMNGVSVDPDGGIWVSYLAFPSTVPGTNFENVSPLWHQTIYFPPGTGAVGQTGDMLINPQSWANVNYQDRCTVSCYAMGDYARIGTSSGAPGYGTPTVDSPFVSFDSNNIDQLFQLYYYVPTAQPGEAIHLVSSAGLQLGQFTPITVSYPIGTQIPIKGSPNSPLVAGVPPELQRKMPGMNAK